MTAKILSDAVVVLSEFEKRLQAICDEHEDTTKSGACDDCPFFELDNDVPDEEFIGGCIFDIVRKAHKKLSNFNVSMQSPSFADRMKKYMEEKQ